MEQFDEDFQLKEDPTDHFRCTSTCAQLETFYVKKSKRNTINKLFLALDENDRYSKGLSGTYISLQRASVSDERRNTVSLCCFTSSSLGFIS